MTSGYYTVAIKATDSERIKYFLRVYADVLRTKGIKSIHRLLAEAFNHYELTTAMEIALEMKSKAEECYRETEKLCKKDLSKYPPKKQEELKRLVEKQIKISSARFIGLAWSNTKYIHTLKILEENKEKDLEVKQRLEELYGYCPDLKP